jgi:hypothetical protein
MGALACAPRAEPPSAGVSAGSAPKVCLSAFAEAPMLESKREMAFRHVIDGRRIVARQVSGSNGWSAMGAIRPRPNARWTCSIAHSTFSRTT